MLNFCPLSVEEVYTCGVMRCGRGLCTTHYIVLSRLTIYFGARNWRDVEFSFRKGCHPLREIPLTLQKYILFVNLQNLIQISTVALFATVGSISFCRMKPAPARWGILSAKRIHIRRLQVWRFPPSFPKRQSSDRKQQRWVLSLRFRYAIYMTW